MTEIQNQFDYNSLDVEIRERVKVKTAEINFYLGNTVQSAIEAGKRFIEVRELLKHNKCGGFEGWLKQEFGMSQKTAYHFIYLAESPNLVNFTRLNIPKSIAYLLSAPSTPESAVTEAIERAEAGEKLTVKDTKELITLKKRIGEQEEEIKKRGDQLERLQEQIADLKAQLSTADVKKQIADLEAQIKENPVEKKVEVEVPPKYYEDLKKLP